MSLLYLKIGLTDDVLQILGKEPVVMIDKLNSYVGGKRGIFTVKKKTHCQSLYKVAME